MKERERENRGSFLSFSLSLVVTLLKDRLIPIKATSCSRPPTNNPLPTEDDVGDLFISPGSGGDKMLKRYFSSSFLLLPEIACCCRRNDEEAYHGRCRKTVDCLPHSMPSSLFEGKVNRNG